MAEHLALRGWCLGGRAPAVTWWWPASPRPAPLDVTGGPDPEGSWPRDSKPKSERLSGGARPGLRARTTERLRPSQASMHTGSHRAHGGSGGSSGSHGRAGYKEEMSRGPGPDLAPGRGEDQQAGCCSPPRLLGEAPLFGRPGPRAPSTRCRAARRGPRARRPRAFLRGTQGPARPRPAPGLGAGPSKTAVRDVTLASPETVLPLAPEPEQ